MKTCGIDYSLCSPALVVIDSESDVAHGYYLTDVNRNAKTYDLGWFKITGQLHAHHTTPEQRYYQISDWAMSIVESCDRVIMEDYALGAKGKVFHIGENAGLLKWKMWKAGKPLTLVGPTALKKEATGKGNADKVVMHDAFVAATRLNLVDAICPGSTKVANPVSDLVDAWWLAKHP